MDKITISELIRDLGKLHTDDMYGKDFLLTWDKTEAEIQAIFFVSDILRALRKNNISAICNIIEDLSLKRFYLTRRSSFIPSVHASNQSTTSL
jgi:hypothetical protein